MTWVLKNLGEEAGPGDVTVDNYYHHFKGQFVLPLYMACAADYCGSAAVLFMPTLQIWHDAQDERRLTQH